MAIMGFGGGAMVGSPLADRLMKFFARPDSVGVWQTFLALAAIYFVFMMIGAFTYRVPPEGWSPPGWSPKEMAAAAQQRSFSAAEACRTPQFWLLWLVLCLNVSAGIGVIGMASPMLQEIFGGRLLGIDTSFDNLDAAQLGRVAAIGAGFTGLLSLFNILGRFFWSALSDSLGRKTTYALFFLLGMLLYAAVPAVGRTGSVPLFCGVLCLILTMYGGGFAAIPAYLADLFGPRFVGAIHGRLLTAWSVAGVLGPVLVNYVNEQQVRAGVPRSAAYDRTMILLAGLLAIGFVCNLLVKPVDVVSPEALGPTAASSSPPANEATETVTRYANRGIGLLVGLWLIVALPLAWGLWTTLQQAWVLFG
jgi:MFS family permease